MSASIASRVLNVPLFVQREKLDALLWALRSKLPFAVEQPNVPEIEAGAFIGSRYDAATGRVLSYRFKDGVAIIDVQGTLVNRGAWLDAYSGMTSYEGIERQLHDAAEASDVRAIVFDIESSGGEGSGLFSLAERIREVRQQKPVIAVVNDVAASAAYAIACSASEVWTSPSGFLGSIGVIYVHLDKSEMLENEGIKPTIITAGGRKAWGNEYEPLSEEARSWIEGIITDSYERFVQLVAAGRGERMTAEAARATDAGLFVGQQAVEIGLADRIGTLRQAVAALSQRGTGRGSPGGQKLEGKATMSDDKTFTADDVENVRSDALATGSIQERERITAILRADAAKGRMEQALMLALDSDVEANTAIKLMEASPRESERAVPSLDQRAADEPDTVAGVPGNSGTPGPAGQSKSEAAPWPDVYAKLPGASR